MNDFSPHLTDDQILKILGASSWESGAASGGVATGDILEILQRIKNGLLTQVEVFNRLATRTSNAALVITVS